MNLYEHRRRRAISVRVVLSARHRHVRCLGVAEAVTIGRVRAQGQFDVYNVFNSGAVLATNGTYGTSWLTPSAILGARLIKFGLQLDVQ
jgi:hypothetical protein